jgi:hypothetical protein
VELIHRDCPLCGKDDYEEVLSLEQHHFVDPNSTYRQEFIPELGLDPEQKYPFVSCRSCGMVYSLYCLDDERLGIVYNRIIGQEKSLEKAVEIKRRIEDVSIWKSILHHLLVMGNGPMQVKILDYGCGWGTILQAAMGPGVTAVGLDATGYKAEWAAGQGITMCDTEAQLEAFRPFDVLISTSVI